jgi:hypothetical protein
VGEAVAEVADRRVDARDEAVGGREELAGVRLDALEGMDARGKADGLEEGDRGRIGILKADLGLDNAAG